MQEQNKLNLIRKDGQTLMKVIHMKHAGVAEVNITCFFFFVYFFWVASKLKLQLKFCYLTFSECNFTKAKMTSKISVLNMALGVL